MSGGTEAFAPGAGGGAEAASPAQQTLTPASSNGSVGSNGGGSASSGDLRTQALLRSTDPSLASGKPLTPLGVSAFAAVGRAVVQVRVPWL